MNMEPRNLHNAMTEDEYDRERAKLRETYGGGIGKSVSVEARTKGDMTLCKFFVETGWTQERLARKEGISQQAISRRLRFGHFLTHSTTAVVVLPKNLTETRFTAKLGAEGICWARAVFDNPEGLPVYKGDDVGILFAETRLHSFLRWLGSEVIHSKTPELKRASIIAAMHVTFAVPELETEARDFWADVARGGKEFEPKAPSSVLDKELKDFFETGEGCGEQKPANFFNGCLFAWSAHRKDKQIDKIDWSVSKGFQRIK